MSIYKMDDGDQSSSSLQCMPTQVSSSKAMPIGVSQPTVMGE